MDIRVGLLTGISVGGVRVEPARMRERQSGEGQVLRLLVIRRARHDEECLNLRKLDVDLSHVLPGERKVVEHTSRDVLVPLARTRQQRVGILDVNCVVGFGGARKWASNRVPTERLVEPRRLHHRYRAVRDGLHRRVVIRLIPERVDLYAVRLSGVVQEAHAGVERESGIVVRHPVSADRVTGPSGNGAVDVELPGGKGAGCCGFPDILAGIADSPARDLLSARKHRVSTSCGLPLIVWPFAPESASVKIRGAVSR